MHSCMPQSSTTMEQDLRTSPAHIALVGWNPDAMAGLRKAGMSFLAIVPPDFAANMEEHGIPYEPWDFSTIDEKAFDLGERLKNRGVGVAVPLYEETVAWAGTINGHLNDDPRHFRRSLVFRDKAMMKRMAQMHGLRVGAFEEVEDAASAKRFVQRVQDAILDDETPRIIHLKPLDAAGAYGHHVIRKPEDVDALEADSFPCIMESHLEGQEFSCEIFVHDGEIMFLNITEYVRLGHSNFIPASPELEQYRPHIEKACKRLVKACGLRYGMLHPEFFITDDTEIRFGEVAARVPGGHIFQLMGTAYEFDPYVAMAKCWDPETPKEELEEMFPQPVDGATTVAGCLMVYPKPGRIDRLDVPTEVEEDEYFDGHTLVSPIPGKVPERDAFGNHFGTVFFRGDDTRRMREILKAYDALDYYA